MEFLKPENLNNVWASGGDRLYPGDTKYASGWGVEIPPRQYFNQNGNRRTSKPCNACITQDAMHEH